MRPNASRIGVSVRYKPRMTAATLTGRLETGARSWLAFAGLLALGSVLWFVCRGYPAELPFFFPWEFSWPVFLATSLSLAWFFAGLQCLPRSQHPPVWRSVCFVLGVLSLYAMVQ